MNNFLSNNTSKPFKQIDANKLEIKDGGGCFSLFGIPFLLSGIFVLLIGIKVIPLTNANEVPVWSWPVLCLMGIVFIIAGGSLIFGRSWTILDINEKKVIKKWGLLVPMNIKTMNILDYKSLVLNYTPGDSDTSERYSIILKGEDNTKNLDLFSSTEFSDSFSMASFLVKFLQLPLEDSSTSHKVLYNYETIDGNFSKRLKENHFSLSNPVLPVKHSCIYDLTDNSLQITRPAPNYNKWRLLYFLIIIICLYYFMPNVFSFFDKSQTPKGIQFAIISFALFFIILIPLLVTINSIILEIRGKSILTVDKKALTIEEKDSWRSKKTFIPAEEILDLDYHLGVFTLDGIKKAHLANINTYLPPKIRNDPWWYKFVNKINNSNGITIKTIKGIYNFGAGLWDDEVLYIYYIIVNKLTV